jgi:hypothetical protein
MSIDFQGNLYPCLVDDTAHGKVDHRYTTHDVAEDGDS